MEEEDGSSQQIITSTTTSHTAASSPGEPHFFEFLTDVSSEMCPAEDIIFCGKLLTTTSTAAQPHPASTKLPNHEATRGHGGFVPHRRSESLSDIYSCCGYATTSASTATCLNCANDDDLNNRQFLRISRSLDYQKLRRFDTQPANHCPRIDRSTSVKKPAAPSNSKPRWYFPMFGILKFPPEMHLRDIKTRQFRRGSSVMFPSLDECEGVVPGKRSTGKSPSSSSWRFIKALSCSDHASVGVTTPICVSNG